MVIPAVARITKVVDRFDTSKAAAAAILSSPYASPFVAMSAKIGLALAAVQCGDNRVAADHYAALVPQRGTTLWFAFMSADRLLGLLAQTMGDLEVACEHFEDALALCRKAGYRPELAWTCCDYADTLLQRNEPGDREKAMSLLNESLAISTELGMRPLMERVLSRWEILKA